MHLILLKIENYLFALKLTNLLITLLCLLSLEIILMTGSSIEVAVLIASLGGLNLWKTF